MSKTPESSADQSAEQSAEPRSSSPEPSLSSQMPTKTLRLSRQQAANWLTQVNLWLYDDANHSAELESLRNALEDACWLARWQREEVTLDLCPTVVAGLLETLVRIHVETSSEMVDGLEDILKKLSTS